VGKGGRNDASADRQDVRRTLERLLEVAVGLLDEGRDQEVADRVTAQRTGLVLEPMLEQIGHQFFCIGEGNETVAHVAGRNDPHLLHEAPAAAAVVGHGHDRGDVR